MTEEKLSPLQNAYNEQCAIIGNAYTVIQEYKAILKAATAKRAQILLENARLLEAQEKASKDAEDESHNDRK